MSRPKSQVMALLDVPLEDETLVPKKSDWKCFRDVHALFAKLLTLDDTEVSRILTFVVAETLPSGTALVEVLGQMLRVDVSQSWSADQCFFDLLRDKPAINAMLEEVGGKSVAEGNRTATAKVQKQIVQDYLSGKRKGGTPDWEPRYIVFPMEAYTERGGLSAVDTWGAVKSHYTQ